MEWIREWIMKVAGITALGAVCDMVMTDGAMKKYVKMVVGLVLVFAVISPIAEVSPKMPDIKILEETQRKAAELKLSITEKEYEHIVGLYSHKLQKSMENKIYSDFGCDIEVKVKVNENDDKAFGDITAVLISIPRENKRSAEDMRKTISKEFGVKLSAVEIEIEN